MGGEGHGREDVIGWREWIALPALGIPWIKAKTDTGARTSALHAFDLVHFERDGRPMVRFDVHPIQRDATTSVTAEAEQIDVRPVRNSGGREEHRPVIATDIELRGQRWRVEITLTRRDLMGFRMLLGREAVRGRFLVDPGRSYLAGVPPEVRALRRKRRRERRLRAAEEGGDTS
ncbi:MAG: ATP-dependent zinc protease [Myxococcota bacterium]